MWSRLMASFSRHIPMILKVHTLIRPKLPLTDKVLSPKYPYADASQGSLYRHTKSNEK